MNQSTTQKKVEYLLQGASLAEALQDDTATRTVQFLELPVEKIDKLCIAEFERRRELVERWRFYNQPHASADFELFGKVGHWTAPETVALLLGKNSDFVNWHYLKEFQAHDEQAFTDFQSLRIENLDLNHYLTKRYLELCVMLSRAEVFIPKTRDVDPVSALSWARGNDIAIPAHLEAVFAGKNARTVTWMTPAAEPADSTPAASSNVAPEPQAVPVVPVSASGGVELLPADEPKRKAATGTEFSMARSALVSTHLHNWPTIDRDLKDAATNGLAAAKAGARDWNEAAALAWAQARGKLKSATKPADALTQAMHSMGSLPGRKHTLEG